MNGGRFTVCSILITSSYFQPSDILQHLPGIIVNALLEYCKKYPDQLAAYGYHCLPSLQGILDPGMVIIIDCPEFLVLRDQWQHYLEQEFSESFSSSLADTKHWHSEICFFPVLMF